MPRKWGGSDSDAPGTDEAANYAAMEKQRRKVERLLTVGLVAIIAGSLLIIITYWI